MTTPRIYLRRALDVGARLELEKDHLRYLKNVLRLKKGDPLILFSGKGVEYGAVIHEILEDVAAVDIVDRRNVRDAGIKITLAQALPKGPKMDFIVQKATELGAERILPFHSLRSIPKLAEDKARHKTDRWQKIAIEACRQCGRADIPEVAEIQTFRRTLEEAAEGSLKLILWEEESRRQIKDVLQRRDTQGIRDFFVLVGPEGGFSHEEVDAALAAGCLPVSLGPRVLKVETAALAVLAILQYERGIPGSNHE